jgi:hypothetical protein
VALPTRPEVRLPTRKPLEWAAHLANAKKAIKAWHARVTSVSAPHWEDAADLMTENFGELKWRIRGLLIDKSLVVVAADPKASKTWLLLELAIAQATATKAFDTHEAAEGASMMFLTEDSRRSLRNRIRGLMQTRGLSSTDADLAASKIKLRVRQQLDLCNWNDVAGLVASVYASPVRPAMICLDPLRNLHDKDEDKSGEMREVMAALRCIRDLCNCAVVFAHHNSKPSSNGDKRAAAHRMRGSSAIHGAVDGLINMVNTEIGPNTITNDVVVVLKDARGAGSFQLELRIDDDDGGEAKRAQWFVREVEAAAKGGKPVPKATTPQQELDAETKIIAHLAASNRRCKTAGQAALPQSKRALLSAVRSKLDKGLRTDAFFALVDAMVDRGKLAIVPGRGSYQLFQLPGALFEVIDGGPPSDPQEKEPNA